MSIVSRPAAQKRTGEPPPDAGRRVQIERLAEELGQMLEDMAAARKPYVVN